MRRVIRVLRCPRSEMRGGWSPPGAVSASSFSSAASTSPRMRRRAVSQMVGIKRNTLRTVQMAE